jgi:hypothetical protein
MSSAVERQTERIRQMSADDKVRIAHGLWLEARAAIEAGVRGAHADWKEPDVAARVRELMSDAGA